MSELIIKKLEDRKTRLKIEIKELEKEKQQASRRVSEVQVIIVGLNGELNATNEIIQDIIRNQRSKKNI